MDIEALEKCFLCAEQAQVVCIGDVMIDRFVYGEVSRISPEAPVPVFRYTGEVSMLGGVGNVARNLATWNGLFGYYAVVPSDGLSRVHFLNKQAGIHGYLYETPHGEPFEKSRYVAGGQQIMRMDTGVLEADETQGLGQMFCDSIGGAHDESVILVSDYAKGVITAGLMDDIRACAPNRIIYVDPKGRDWAKYGTVSMIKPNARELSEFVGMPTDTDAEVEAAIKVAFERCEAFELLVTRADKGMTFATSCGNYLRHFPATRRQVFDASGAGDTALATLGFLVSMGVHIESAIEVAIIASGLVVEKPGTAVVTPREIVNAVAQHRGLPPRKLETMEELQKEIAIWKSQGLKIGFTNGCFDILHRGHITYLAQARSWCDRLIVGVNGDESIRRLKGPDRPLNNIEDRLAVLAGVGSVDRMIVFTDDTPELIIQGIDPDILIKGSDYAGQVIVGADYVLSRGGEVLLADYIEGVSSSEVIRKARA